jgi:hypothetical protein
MQYKNTRENTAQIARELGVNYLLEGSIRRSGERLRVTAQLIQARDQTHIWAGNFDRDVTDILQLESDVARAIAAKTQLTLSEQVEARLTGTRRVNIEAHEAYLRGLQAWNLRTRKGSESAIADFKQTIAFDANDAFGHVGLARVYSLAPVFDVLKPAESMPKARDEAMRLSRWTPRWPMPTPLSLSSGPISSTIGKAPNVSFGRECLAAKIPNPQSERGMSSGRR